MRHPGSGLLQRPLLALALGWLGGSVLPVRVVASSGYARAFSAWFDLNFRYHREFQDLRAAASALVEAVADSSPAPSDSPPRLAIEAPRLATSPGVLGAASLASYAIRRVVRR